MSDLEPVSADIEYGRTRGVEAYFLLLEGHPDYKDKTVQEIADRALQLAVLVDNRPDIMPQRAARFTAKSISQKTFKNMGNGSSSSDI